MELDYRPEHAEKNYQLISSEVAKLHDGKIEHVGKVKMIIRGLDNDKKKKKVMNALKKAFPNVDMEEKENRLVVKTSYKKKQLLHQLKQKGQTHPLMADIRWGGAMLKHVSPPKPKDVLLGQALMEKVLKKPMDSQTDWNKITKMMEDIQKMEKRSARRKQNVKVQGVRQLMQEAQHEAQAVQWMKQLEEEKRVKDIKHKFQPIVKQLLEKPVRLRAVDKGAEQWEKQLEQQARVQEIRQRLKPVHKQLGLVHSIRKILKPEMDQQNVKRVQKIKQGLGKVLKQIKKGTGIHRLRPVDKGAEAWVEQMQQQQRIKGIRQKMKPTLEEIRERTQPAPVDKQNVKRVEKIKQKLKHVLKQIKKGKPVSSQKDPMCEEWEVDKSHNPFNKTKKGPKLHPGSPVFQEVWERCENKQEFCQKNAKNKKKSQKYC